MPHPMICPACSKEVTEQSEFCPSCGSALSLSQIPTVSRVESPGVSPPKKRSSVFDFEARYVPGTTLAERYRMVALLGKGGMGEVYRAEDLKLGQTVALKFLPASVAHSEAAQARFHREVRLARQVSHPNVCRVFDIGEAGGRTFITMEYVDGEDLASLLRRIGRLPPDKALEIARQMCAGLAAAHEHGIVHRDLKPANVMLDGRGRVRITDFGLAGAATELQSEDASAGTPAYMSPEQLDGREATQKSDLYALGLVLYETFTGRPAFDAPTYLEIVRLREKSTPTFPSHLTKDIDPLIQRLILRCLEKDPAKRPTSALQVAAALPGGDPLAAALAAGETPSPGMVAAAGEAGTLSPAKAWALFASVIVGLLAVIAILRYAQLVNLLPGTESPATLTERARQIARELGQAASPEDSAYWYQVEDAYWPYLSKIPAPERYRNMRSQYPGPLQFFYRQSPEPFRTNFPWRVDLSNPELFYSGELTIGLDVQGRLTYFSKIAASEEPAPPAETPIDWSSFLREAGLDSAKARTIQASWYPDVAADQQITWDVEHDSKSIEVRAGAYRGRPVFFVVQAPWARPSRAESLRTAFVWKFGSGVFVIVAIAVQLFCVFLARRNIRLGRGDTRGALRVSFVLFAAQFIWMTLSSHYSSNIWWAWGWWQVTVGLCAGIGLQFWIVYVALEPYIRRYWPEMLISWSRFLSGQFRNPLVGRDVLLGVLFGVLALTAATLPKALPHWLAIKGINPIFTGSPPLEDNLTFVGLLISNSIDVIMNSVGFLTVLVILWRLTRSKTAAIIVLGFLGISIHLIGENLPVEFASQLVRSVLVIICLTRFGLLSLAFALWSFDTLLYSPVTWEISRWYAGRGAAAMLVVLALALYGFRTSLGGRPMLGPAFED